jgi:hypothetical protein
MLMVEDERLIAHDLQWGVTRLGYTVVALVATGPEAIQQALARALMRLRYSWPGPSSPLRAAEQGHILAHTLWPL